ncbi:MAG: glycosyltransferase family 4 protein [Candidatus Zixiibacteriota bacterium]
MAEAHEHSWSMDTPAVAPTACQGTPRVLFVGQEWGSGSGSAELIAQGLVEEGWNATVSLPPNRDSYAPSEPALFYRGQQRLISWRALFSDMRSYDVVHVTCGSLRQIAEEVVPALVLARFFNRKAILHFESAEIETQLERHRRWLLPALKLGGMAVTGSRHLQKVLTRAGLSVRLLTPPVSLGGLTHRVRSKLQPRILMNTPLEPDFNVPSSIRAFRLVKQKYPRAEMEIVGRGSQRQTLENLVRQSRINGVEFRGEIAAVELTSLYNECDLFLHAPLIDESPRAVVRAFAAGLPVVVSDADGLLHMVRDRSNALVAPMGDHAALADAIIELVENQELCERLSSAGKAEAEKYTWSRVRQDWINLYNSQVN